MSDNNTRDGIAYYGESSQKSSFRDHVPILKRAHVEDDVTRYGETPRISLLMELTDRVGILHDVLRHFWKHDVNICRIESRPVVTKGLQRRFDFYVDLEGSLSDARFEQLLDALRPITDKLLILDEKQVSWFPRHVSELDMVVNRVLDAGA
jgi:predicted amino acid-binding ACT domain protein